MIAREAGCRRPRRARSRLNAATSEPSQLATAVGAGGDAELEDASADSLERSATGRLWARDGGTATQLHGTIAQAARPARLEQQPRRTSTLQLARRSQREPSLGEIAPFRFDVNEMDAALTVE